MADDVLAALRPPGGWWAIDTDDAPVSNPESPPSPSATKAKRAARADEERWLLACIGRGHVRWRGEGTRRVASRVCAHTDQHADVTDPVARIIAAGHAQRSGGNQGGVHLTVDGRRRLAELERNADG